MKIDRRKTTIDQPPHYINTYRNTKKGTKHTLHLRQQAKGRLPFIVRENERAATRPNLKPASNFWRANFSLSMNEGEDMRHARGRRAISKKGSRGVEGAEACGGRHITCDGPWLRRHACCDRWQTDAKVQT